MLPAWQNKPRSGQPKSSEGASSGMFTTWQNQRQNGPPTSSEGVHIDKVPPRTSQQNQPQVLQHVSLLAPVK